MTRIKAAAMGIFALATVLALGASPAGAQESNFEKVQLVSDSLNPMTLDVAPDGRVFYIERFGDLRVWDPGTEDTTTIGTISVYGGLENGLLGLALAPDFDQSSELYLHYSVPPQATLTQRISRFTLDAGGELDVASEEAIYEYTHQRDTCCHSAGDIEFGPDGSLYIATGDNVNPFESQRLHADRRAARARGVRRPAHLGEHEQPQREDPADHADRRDRPRGRAWRRLDLHHPRGQPVRARDRRNPPGDLRDGLPQPVPVRGRPGDGLAAGRRLRSRRGADQSEPRPARQRRVERPHRARQLRLALLRPREHPLRRLRLRDRDLGNRLRLRQPGQRLAEQHRAHRAPAGEAGDDVAGLQRNRPAGPGSRHRVGRRTAGPATNTTPPTPRRPSFPPSTTATGS